MKNGKKISIVLLALLLASMALVPVVSATPTLSAPAPWIQKSSHVINYGGSGTLSSGTAESMTIVCVLKEGNTYKTSTTRTLSNVGTISQDGSFYPATHGKTYYATCTVQSTNPTLSTTSTTSALYFP